MILRHFRKEAVTKSASFRMAAIRGNAGISTIMVKIAYFAGNKD